MSFRGKVRVKVASIEAVLFDSHALIRPAPADADVLDSAILKLASQYVQHAQFMGFALRYQLDVNDPSEVDRIKNALRESALPGLDENVARNSNRALKRLMAVVNGNANIRAALLKKWKDGHANT